MLCCSQCGAAECKLTVVRSPTRRSSWQRPRYVCDACSQPCLVCGGEIATLDYAFGMHPACAVRQQEIITRWLRRRDAAVLPVRSDDEETAVRMLLALRTLP